VEANRLRHKLREYYEDEGQGDEVRIELPKGSYSPVFRIAHPPEQVSEDIPREEPLESSGSGRKRIWYATGIASAALLLVVGVTLVDRGYIRSKPEPGTGTSSNFIAVLPFLNLSGNGEDERLTDGFAEELTNRLARFSELRVVARRSAFQFKGKPYDVRHIGEQLHVGSILEGSVKREGDRFQVTAELVSTRDGYHLWSDRFESG